MSTVLFDTPGPRTRARHRLYSILTAVVIALLLLLLIRQMYNADAFEYEKWEYFVTPEYLRTIIVDGLLGTLQAAVVAILAALAIGIAFGVGKLSDHAAVRWPCWTFVEFFRAVPLLLLIIFLYYMLSAGPGGIDEVWTLAIGLALYNGAVLAEIVRAGVNSVPRGQSEAAFAIGLRKGQVTRAILLPQAIKAMLPAMISQFVVCLKDTSLGYAIGAVGLTTVMESIWLEGRNQVQAVIVLATLYILLCVSVSKIATWVQRRYVGESKVPAPMVTEETI